MGRVFDKWTFGDTTSVVDKICFGLAKLGFKPYSYEYLEELEEGCLDELEKLASEYLTLKAEAKARKEKEERIKNIKVGDGVSVFGFGKIETNPCMGDAAFFGNGPSIVFEVVAISDDCITIKSSNGRHQWSLYKSQIFDVFPVPVHKVRGRDRRREVYVTVSGTDLHIVRTLESVSKLRSLSEDEIEVLKSAQSRIREDGTANGFRKSGRRANDRF